MADLDFSHHVSEVPQGEALPKSYQRKETASVTQYPDIQSAMSNYAAATNWMSNLGSTIAAKSSNAIANQLGVERGKNPQGEIGIPLTEFDSVMQKSYAAQSQATLGLQASKLINDTNIELSKAPRLTPDLINKSNRSISIGLQNIFKNAPAEIRPQLENQYGHMQLSMASDLTNRMISEQRKDSADTLTASNKNDAESAYNFMREGKFDEAKRVIDVNKQKNASGYQSRIISKEGAKVAADTVLKSSQTGQLIYEYEQAEKAGKGEAYLANLVKNKPAGFSYEQYEHAAQGLLNHVVENKNLEAQQSQLKIAQFNLANAEGNVSPEMLVDLQQSLTAAQFANVQTELVKAYNKAQGLTAKVNELTSNFTDQTKWSDFTEKEHTAAFQKTAQAHMQSSASQGKPISMDQAEAETAMAAGGPVKSYENKLANMLQSVNPAILDQALDSMDLINAHDKGENLRDLTEKDTLMADKYRVLRDTMNPVEAAQMAHEFAYNTSKDQQDAAKEALAEFYIKNKSSGETAAQAVMRVTSIPTKSNYNLGLMADDSKKIFDSFFVASRGDVAWATEKTKLKMDQLYGVAYYNGRKEYTRNPVTKFANLPDNGNGVIHNDMAEQITKRFADTKDLYDQGKSDFYWEVKPYVTTEQAIHARTEVNKIKENYAKNPVTSGLLDIHNLRGTKNENQKIIDDYNNGPPPTAIQVFRDGTRKQYPINIQASSGLAKTSNGIVGGYYVNLQTPKGSSSVALVDPIAGNIYYMPSNNLSETYAEVNKNTVHEESANMIRDLLLQIEKVKVLGPHYVGK